MIPQKEDSLPLKSLCLADGIPVLPTPTLGTPGPFWTGFLNHLNRKHFLSVSAEESAVGRRLLPLLTRGIPSRSALQHMVSTQWKGKRNWEEKSKARATSSIGSSSTRTLPSLEKGHGSGRILHGGGGIPKDKHFLPLLTLHLPRWVPRDTRHKSAPLLTCFVFQLHMKVSLWCQICLTRKWH